MCCFIPCHSPEEYCGRKAKGESLTLECLDCILLSCTPNASHGWLHGCWNFIVDFESPSGRRPQCAITGWENWFTSLLVPEQNLFSLEQLFLEGPARGKPVNQSFLRTKLLFLQLLVICLHVSMNLLKMQGAGVMDFPFRVEAGAHASLSGSWGVCSLMLLSWTCRMICTGA